jgi:nitrogen fixation/metabolism regulation signal transduction histidine kinase
MLANTMKIAVVILAMPTAQLVTQDKQTQKTEPPQIIVQPESAQISQTEAPPAAQQLAEYENRILDRAETFYNNRMANLLWTMSIIMTAGLAIVGIVIPMLLDRQRRRTFTKEMATHLSQSEDALKKYAEEQTAKLRTELMTLNEDLIKMIGTPLSMAFLGLGHVFSKELSPEGYGLTLQLHVLAMKFYIISHCSGTRLTASQIIQLLTYPEKGSEITLETLKAVDEEIENMKGDVQKIINDKKRVDMKSEVKELQIFVHSLIQRKQQETDTTPPLSG